MEKIIEVTEEIEKKGVEILQESEDKAKEILELTQKNIEKLKSDEVLGANADVNKLYQEFQDEMIREMKKLSAEKDIKINSILKQDFNSIKIDDLILREILEL